MKRAIFVLLLFALPALGLDLEDLNVDSDRLRQSDNSSRWPEPPTIPNTSTWTRYDVTNYGNWSGGSQQCDLSDNLNYDDITCIDLAVAAADTGGGDGAEVYFPAGTYNITSENVIAGRTTSGNNKRLTRDNVVFRCENPETTTIIFEHINEAGSCNNTGGYYTGSGICLGSGSFGASENWTDGFTDDTYTITVDDTDFVDVGDWVKVNMVWNLGCWSDTFDGGSGLTDIFAQHAKVESKTQTTLTLDRPLSMDYTKDSGCTGAKTVTKVNYLDSIGMENCHLRFRDQNRPPMSQYDTLAALAFVTNGWLTGNKFSHAFAGVRVKYSADVNVAHNGFEDMNCYRNIKCGDGTGDSIILGRQNDAFVYNNYFKYSSTMFYAQHGANRNVFGHNFHAPMNYLDDAGINFLTHGKSTYHHGKYVRQMLTEANDIQGNPVFDNYWGIQGPKNTLYRNRMHTDYKTHGHDPQRTTVEALWFNTHANWGDLRKGIHNIIDFGAVIGNHSEWFLGHGAGDDPWDGNSGWYDYTLQSAVSNLHFEFNYASEYIVMITPNESTNCGTGNFGASTNPAGCIPGWCNDMPHRNCNEDSDCYPDNCWWPLYTPPELECSIARDASNTMPETDCAENNNFHGRNYEADGVYSNGAGAPAEWVQKIPSSLYLTEPPSWWCEEACNFDQTGIGAFGDRTGRCYTGGVTPTEQFCRYDVDCPGDNDTCEDGDFCMLPAEIRMLGLPCTPLKIHPPAGPGVQGGGVSGGGVS